MAFLYAHQFYLAAVAGSAGIAASAVLLMFAASFSFKGFPVINNKHVIEHQISFRGKATNWYTKVLGASTVIRRLSEVIFRKAKGWQYLFHGQEIIQKGFDQVSSDDPLLPEDRP